MNQLKALVYLSFVFATACGGSQGQPSSADAPPAEPTVDEAQAGQTPAEPTPAPAPGEGAKPFDQLTQTEQIAFMKDVVVPTMKPLFQAHDAKEFGEFGCVTCHGPGAKLGKFEMPSADLPKLDPKDHFAVHMKKTPEMTKFMIETVTPQMAKALNEPMYDPATQKGFGCAGCHEIKM